MHVTARTSLDAATVAGPGAPLRDVALDVGRQVVALEARALTALADGLDASFTAAVAAILATSQRIIVSGIGKSGHVARKVAATLASTGSPALFVHAAEAAHGDLGMVLPGDLLLVFSNSGETAELLPLCLHGKRLGCRLVGVARNPQSSLLRMADIALLLPDMPEACPSQLAPTTSTTLMMALGDALAVAAMQARGLTREAFRALHPGGQIGRRLRGLEDVMHGGDRLPLVAQDTPMPQVMVTMTEKRLGMTGVVDAAGRLVGVITDGDLRRHADQLFAGTAADVMTHRPRTITGSALVEDALRLMQSHRISVLFVVNEAAPELPVGVVQIYDLTAVAQPAGPAARLAR